MSSNVDSTDILKQVHKIARKRRLEIDGKDIGEHSRVTPEEINTIQAKYEGTYPNRECSLEDVLRITNGV